jgi:hypothetical protein
MASSDRPIKSWAEPERLWKLAHKIEDSQLWASFLSEQEHAIWRKSIRARETWDEFLEGRGELVEMGASQDSGGSVKDGENGEKITDPVTTAFRARVMLYESVVRKMFPSGTGDDPLDFDLDEISGHVKDNVNKPEDKPKARDIEEDNYDDDEEEDDTVNITVPDLPSHDGDSSLDSIGIAALLKLMADDTPPLPQIKSFPMDTYYHTFEHDRVAMLELQTVEVNHLLAADFRN